MLSSRGGLSVAELVFYFPALVVSVYVAFRHGFRRTEGWVFLVLLSLVRIIGACAEIASESHPTSTNETMAFVLSSVGLSPLLLAMIGILNRINSGMSKPIVPSIAFNLLAIVPVVGLILSIVAGIDLSDSGSSSFHSGEQKYHASAILFLVAFLLAVGITFAITTKLNSVQNADTRLFYTVAFSIPFLLVRVVFLLLVAFHLDDSSSPFGVTHGNILIQAFMAIFEEFCVVIAYLAAGLVTPKIEKSSQPTS